MSEDAIKTTVRTRVVPSDAKRVEEIVKSSGFFRADEIEVAVELVNEHLEKGSASGYEFIFIESAGKTIAYACYGQIPCTKTGYDLYWIATDQDYRDKGFGKELLIRVEEAIRQRGGKAIYVETSSLEKYHSTRSFYLKNQYIEKCVFEDFYDIDDHKVVFVKKL